MPRFEIKGRAATPVASLVISLACLGLGACGSSSGGSSSGGSSSSASTSTAAHTTAAATPTTPASTPSTGTTSTNAAPASTGPSITTHHQLVLVYECLARNGFKLPPLGELSRANPKVVKSARYQSTLAKCTSAVLG